MTSLARTQSGFTLIEVLVFIIVTSMVMSTLLLGANTALRQSPTIHQQWVALQTSKECMEWFLNQRRLNGYTALTCPSTPSAATCTAPAGFTVTNAISCTTWNSDSNFKTITVSVTGAASASLSTQIGNY
jgi:type II secretory pathway pseudopilin PulG